MCGIEQHAKLRRAGHAGGPQGRPVLICAAILMPPALSSTPGKDESRRPEGGAPVASSLLQKEMLVACH